MNDTAVIVSNATNGSSTEEFPLCIELLCENYWKQSTIIGWINIIGRMSITILIFLLGTKMQKDFIRSVTVTIFIPIFVGECFNVYCEVMAFASLFSLSIEVYIQFEKNYISWTDQFVYLLFDYNHYNTLIMLILLVWCCRLATKPGDHINLFPMNSICAVLQVIPFFVSILVYIEQDAIRIPVLVMSLLARLVTVLGVIALIFLIFFSIPILFRELPYGHAGTPDIQLQDARSRLAWCLIYIFVPLLTLLPFFAESIAWISVMGKTTDKASIPGAAQKILELVKYLINYYRPTWLVIITMAFLPPYRRAVPLLIMSCSCCPQIKVDAVPRRPKETSNMYRYAD